MGLNMNAQMLLQKLMSSSAVDEQSLGYLARETLGADISPRDLKEMLRDISENIRSFGLDLKQTVYDDGKVYHAVVNTSKDAMTEFSSSLKQWEILLFRKAIMEIVESDEGVISDADIINLREGTSITEVTQLISKLIATQWLVALEPRSSSQSQRGREGYGSITLGPRCYLELGSFLQKLHIRKCSICQSAILRGPRCHTKDCMVVLHQACLAKYEKRGLSYKCGECDCAIESTT